MIDHVEGYGVPEQDLFDLVLSFTRPNWRKVALVMSQSLHQCGEKYKESDVELVIRRLVEEGILDSRGRLSMYRHSEIRLAEGRSVLSSG